MKPPRAPQHITMGFAFSFVARAIQEALAERKFGSQEMAEVIKYFGTDPPECVYCGSQDVKRWDHMVAVKRGGDTVLGNMAPACARCDDSKRDLPYDKWMLSDAAHSPNSQGVPDLDRRIARLRAYANRYGYVPRTTAEKIATSDHDELRKLQQKLKDVRKELEQFLERQRKNRHHS